MDRRRYPAVKRILVSAALLSLATACSTWQPERRSVCALGSAPPILLDKRAQQGSMNLRVLTYNVEGLPWPARRDRNRQLQEIARQLSELRGKNAAPDIVLVQEAFKSEAASIGLRAGYLNYVPGPAAGQRRPPTSPEADPSLTNRRKLAKGEGFGKFLSSGLYIFSDYPIAAVGRQPFRSRECAGYDCLANKGVMHARILIPGLPVPIDIFNTHLNARGAAGVSSSRSLKAHRLQVNEISRFIEERWDHRNPLLFGGDFNMRNAPSRFEHFSEATPYRLVHQHCVDVRSQCDVRLSWDGDEPWMDTQDLQGFQSGDKVAVEPIRVEAMFDQPWRDGKPLSDHDGLLVVYRLTWPLASSGRADPIPVCA
jgi:endonuclease/exonuclease/phosphatase family metal-dependent hydrolase